MKKLTLFLLALFLIKNISAQQPQTLINSEIEKNLAYYTELFKDLHQNPELGFMETRSAGILAKELKSYGYDVTEGIATTGIAAVMKNGSGPVVMYRADMDALPVKETTDIPWISTKKVTQADGSETFVSHMCGHDAHMTWMLQTARFFAEHKNLWKGTVVFIGQPAEETVEGAQAMVKDGLYTTSGIPEPDFLLGLHTTPIAVGSVIAASGVRMAGTDQLDVTFRGIGGHGSSPHLTKDPVVMAASAIMQYQTIISRTISPQETGVITVGSVQAGEVNNVIPPSALLKLNLRWYNEATRDKLIDGIKRIGSAVALANNLPESLYPEYTFKGNSFPMVNDENLTTTVRNSLKPVFGNESIQDETTVPPSIASEDFQHLVLDNSKPTPYTFLHVGIADPGRYAKSIEETGNPPYFNHNGDYEVDLTAIPFGAKVGITALLAVFNQ